MKPVLLCLLFAALASVQARAQESARVETFAGYSYLGYYTYQGFTGPWTLSGNNGIEGSLAVRVLPHLAGEADVSFEQHAIQTYMGGPRVSMHVWKTELFGHALFGALRHSLGNQTDTTFAMAFGGGADVWFSRHIGVRAVQADYLRNTNLLAGYFANPGQHANFRICSGIAVRF